MRPLDNRASSERTPHTSDRGRRPRLCRRPGDGSRGGNRDGTRRPHDGQRRGRGPRCARTELQVDPATLAGRQRRARTRVRGHAVDAAARRLGEQPNHLATGVRHGHSDDRHVGAHEIGQRMGAVVERGRAELQLTGRRRWRRGWVWRDARHRGDRDRECRQQHSAVYSRSSHQVALALGPNAQPRS
jgi:hypothetical protein